MKKILVIGNTGAGKTTFAKELAEKTGLPLIHLDKIFWCGNWEHISEDELDEKLSEILSRDEWIIDGNYNRTLEYRLEFADTVFFFDLPTVTCLWGITKRIIKNHGKTRPDMGGNCPDSFRKAKELYKSTVTYNRRNRKKYYELLKKSENVIVFQTRKSARKYLEKL